MRRYPEIHRFVTTGDYCLSGIVFYNSPGALCVVDLCRSDIGNDNNDHNHQAKTEAFTPSKTHTSSASNHHSKDSTKSASRSHGQRGIDQERTREIQSALIQQHYLSGEPTGVWDQTTKDALTKFQADNGWQTKLTPDSRALIKLGLGPTTKAC